MPLVKSGGLVLNINWILYNLTRICWDLRSSIYPSFLYPSLCVNIPFHYPSPVTSPTPAIGTNVENFRPSGHSFVRSFVRSFVSLSRARAAMAMSANAPQVFGLLFCVYEFLISFLSWKSSVVCRFVGSLGTLLFFFFFSCEWKCSYNIDPGACAGAFAAVEGSHNT
jgi:hypothetical protein